ncbi:MAG: lipopolysaccharide kinase InaA family protein [Muribaculum sp.]|nr:lipopolysaccharide kinase InaA family protein [Muribaculaceae bacterium]MCM1081327.1 lipopolysaccharide kinase InaA family protein [Muribaculum sp.]
MKLTQDIQIHPDFASDNSIINFVGELHRCFFNYGRVVYNKRNILKIMPTGSLLTPEVAVKRFKPLGVLRGMFYTFVGQSKSQRCFNYAVELEKRGISTPKPIACVQVKQNGILRYCYYICECCELPAIKDGVHWEDKYDAGMAEDFAAMAAKMHEAGIAHGDLNCDNVLYQKENDGHYSFMLIDINRMSIYPAGESVPDRKAMADMCCFTRSLNVMRSVAEYYVKARGWKSSMVDVMVGMKRDFNRRRLIKKRILHPTRKF